MECKKCGALSGDDWSQCGGECPMPGSPHYYVHVVGAESAVLTDEQLPPLPKPIQHQRITTDGAGDKHVHTFEYFTVDQMRDYARAALSTSHEASGEADWSGMECKHCGYVDPLRTPPSPQPSTTPSAEPADQPWKSWRVIVDGVGEVGFVHARTEEDAVDQALKELGGSGNRGISAALATWEAEKASEQQAERLSDEEIDAGRKEWICSETANDVAVFHRGVRFAERAHGIGVKLSSQEGTQS